MKTRRIQRVSTDNLSETVNVSVERALQAREAKSELSGDEIAQVSGAASLVAKFNPEWFGILEWRTAANIPGLRGNILRR